MIGASRRAPPWLQDALPWAAGTRVRVLGERDGRPHVLLLPRGPAYPNNTVAKQYGDDAGSTAVAAMRFVRTGLASLHRAPLAVPEVTAWLPRARVLVQSASPGRPLLPLLLSPSWRQATAAAARALACLHALPTGRGRATALVDHLRELVHPAPVVTAAAVPALATRILNVERVLKAHVWADPPPPVPIHRDAHARQMTQAGSRVWIVDWDLFARGDAALDVANFAVYLRTHLGRRGPAAADAFLDAYVTIGSDVAPRLPVYVALTYLRLASKAVRLRRPGWRRRAGVCLGRAEDALAAVHC